jgi:hypothetical protein
MANPGNIFFTLTEREISVATMIIDERREQEKLRKGLRWPWKFPRNRVLFLAYLGTYLGRDAYRD